MAHVADGSAEHVEPLVRRHAAGLLTFIRGMVYDRHLAEDVFQEVFLAVWRSRRTYDRVRPFKPWLYAIAVNACRRLVLRKPLRLLGGAADEGDPLDTEASPGPSPVDVAVAVETETALQRAVAALPERQAAVVVLRVWNEMSYEQIAQVLGRREATVRSNMHHALKKLRRYLQRPEAEGERR